MPWLFQCLYKGLQHTVDSWTLNLTNLTITNDVSYSGSQSHHLDVRAEQQKAFLEYQSDKEKIGFRLVPISCSISENMLSLSPILCSHTLLLFHIHTGSNFVKIAL